MCLYELIEILSTENIINELQYSLTESMYIIIFEFMHETMIHSGWFFIDFLQNKVKEITKKSKPVLYSIAASVDFVQPSI